MVRQTLNKIALVVMLPAVAAHELTHAVAGKAVGGTVREISLVPPRAVVEYPAGTNTWGIRFANLAPTVVGTVALPILLPGVLLWPFPVVAYVAGSWAVYTLPVSSQDRNPFAHAEGA